MATKRVLAIYWEDASSHDAWADHIELAMFREGRCLAVAVGIEVGRTEHAVHVAVALTADQTGGVWKIPRKLIRRVQVLGKVTVPE